MSASAQGPSAGAELLSRRVLASSALWSLLAQALPALIGLVTIPAIIRGLGVDRFGVLTLAWMIIGYFSFLDFGLGRAVTKFAAELIVSPRPDGGRLIWTAWYLMGAVGLLGGALLAALSPWLVHSAVKIPLALQPETLQAFYLLAASVPLVVLMTGFRGFLEAGQHFRTTSVVKIPMGVLTFVLPLLILRVTPNIAAIVLGLIAVRLIGAIAYYAMCRTVGGFSPRPEPFHARSARMLFGFGAWMTVSNIISPVMMGIDRFIIGAMVSVAAVAYYATPYEAVTKLLLIPTAFAAVLFPAFSSASVIDRSRLARLFQSGLRVLFASIYPLAFLIITFAPELLRAWLGEAFANESTTALRWLTLGVLTNSLASVPFALLQGLGRSDTTAKIHIVEAPFYLLLVVMLIREFGINGAAFAWSIRTTLDMVVLFAFAGRHAGTDRRDLLTGLAVVASLPILGIGLLLPGLLPRAAVTAAVLIVCAIVTWRWMWFHGRRTALG